MLTYLKKFFIFIGPNLQRTPSTWKESQIPWNGFSSQPEWNYLERYFIRSLRKNKIPDDRDLQKALLSRMKVKKLSPFHLKQIKRFRRRWKILASFSPAFTPKKALMNFVLFKLGNVFVDIGFMPQKFKHQNKGFSCFLVAVEAGSQLIHAIPMKSKASHSCFDAVRQLCEESPFEKIHTIWTDRESTFMSRKFQREIMDAFGIRFQFLHFRHKAFFAERAIRTIKRDLHALLKVNETKTWAFGPLTQIVRAHNRKRCHNTSFRRNQVNAKNWKSFLAEFFDVELPDHMLSLHASKKSSIGGSAKQKKRLWSIPLGQAVLLHRKGYSETAEKGSHVKHSVEGVVGSRIFYVHSHALKSSNQTALVPVYQLRTVEKWAGKKEDLKRGYYYKRYCVGPNVCYI